METCELALDRHPAHDCRMEYTPASDRNQGRADNWARRDLNVIYRKGIIVARLAYPSSSSHKAKFPMARDKIVLIGSGQIGGTLAHLVGLKELRCQDVRDIAEGVPQVRLCSISRSPRIDGFDLHLVGANSYEALDNAKVCTVTWLVPPRNRGTRKRDDLLTLN